MFTLDKLECSLFQGGIVSSKEVGSGVGWGGA